MVQGVSEGRNSISRRRNAGNFPTSAGKARTDEPKTYQIDNSLFLAWRIKRLTAKKAKSEAEGNTIALSVLHIQGTTKPRN